MNDNTSWTPSPEDNLLGLTDSNVINEYEATGIAKAELFILNSDEDTEISVSLILEVHKIAFAELYNWAGKWRTSNVVVGQLIPPSPTKVPTLFYQFIENLNFKIENVKTEIDEIAVLAYGHYEFVKIHPFNNGNGRTGRLLMNLIALKFGYQPLELYQRDGGGRSAYINAIRAADKGEFGDLENLIRSELTKF